MKFTPLGLSQSDAQFIESRSFSVEETARFTGIPKYMLQTGKEGGLGAITGSSDSFMSKSKNSNREAKLANYTKVVAGIFLVLTFVLNLF